MFDHSHLLVFTCLACLTHLGAAQFTYDGPYYHEVLAGGLVDLPCYLSNQAKRIILKSFSGPVQTSHTLRWVHRRFDHMVDPWTGDGRRSYLKMGILQTSDPLVEDWGLLNIPMVSGVGLRIVAVNPSTAGLYACLLSRQKFDRGLNLDYENATLLSIHSLRVQEVERSNSEDNSKKKGERIDVKGTQFDEWTWLINPSKNVHPDGTVFKFDCYADIALTGLVLRRVSGSIVRIGWKFIPREIQDAMDVIRASKDDREWSFVSPKEYFHSDEDEMGTLQITSTEENNQKSNQQSIDENVILEGEIEFLDLETAFWEATMHRWKSRWLLLDRKLASKGSGIWQCWLEGIDLYKNKSDKREHMLISEVYVHIITPESSSSLNSEDTWRAMAIWAFPFCVLLLFLIGLVAWAAAVRWTDLLYHPPEKPKIKKDKKTKKKGDDLRMQKTNQTKKLDYLDLAHIYTDKSMEVYNFNQENSTKVYLEKQGVPSRKEKGDLIW